ncbi:MAG: TonB-dependent receptor, partial [Acidobacteriaceae bacterium]|nr:TonB-dependent receptor [Acidobacteriaceae bacterium]
MKKYLLALALLSEPVCATILSTVQGVVHDPSHRAIPGARVLLKASDSAYSETALTDDSGVFRISAVPAGSYSVEISAQGFASREETIQARSGTSPVLHFQLQISKRTETVNVSESADPLGSATEGPVTLVTRATIDSTPGANLANSLRIITDFVPGAYLTHDQLHIRGGHQVTWAIDGVPIPNTNIASNVGPQINPEDIDTVEIERGGYSAEYGDRTYGVFNAVPRTGFETNRQLEFLTTYGSFNQTNDQISLGDHTERFAWFASADGNRSDYGLETPGPAVLHDRAWGVGGFASLIFNPNPNNQFRVVATSRGDDYQIPLSQDMDGAYMNDVERERDSVVTFSWVHSIAPGTVLTVAPFFHFNRANYDGDPADTPIATKQYHDSTYGGAEVMLDAVTLMHNARFGLYGFGQHDSESIAILANDGSGNSVSAAKSANGGLLAAFAEDQIKVTHWLSLTGGLRVTRFDGGVVESAVDPRAGAAVRIPRLNWVLRGYYGAYYQAPPPETVAGPIAAYAVQQGLGIIPLKGERDEENQVGLSVPLRGWSFDVNSFRIRATNYFDHNNVGNSNVFLPLTIASARIWGEEVTIQSPR